MIQFKHGKTTEEVGFHLLQCCFSIRTLTLTHPVIFCGAPIHKTNPWPMPTKRPIAVPLWPRIGSHECPPTSRIAASWASGPDVHVASESSERTYVHTSRYTWYVKYSVYIYILWVYVCMCSRHTSLNPSDASFFKKVIVICESTFFLGVEAVTWYTQNGNFVTVCYGKPPFLMGKSTISMAMASIANC